MNDTSIAEPRASACRERGRRSLEGAFAVVAALGAIFATCAVAPSASALPAGYAYELVSPADKAGGEVSVKDGFGAPNGMVSISGDRIAFTSKTAFSGPVANPIMNSYVSSRDGAGWSTRNITPLSVSATTGCCPQVSPVVQASLDLSKVLVSTSADPVTGVEQPRHNYYLQDLVTGVYRLLTPDPVSGPLDYNRNDHVNFNLGDATPDLRHVAYATTAELTPDAVALPDASVKAYVVDTLTGEVKLASVTGGSPGTPIAIGAGSPGAGRFGGLLENDSHDQNAISADGSKVIFGTQEDSDPGSGGLYQRDLAAGITTRVDVEENVGQSIVPREAIFQDASPDGRYIFFLSAQQLVDGDTDAHEDLYRWDSEAPLGGRLTLISVDDEPADDEGFVWGSIGVSDDGRRVYFNSESQLVPGAPTGRPDNLTLWDDGVLKHVASGDITFTHRHSSVGTSYARALNSDVSPDGSYLVISAPGLTPLSSEFQVHLYEAPSSTAHDPLFTCVSCRPSPQLTPEAGLLQGFGMTQAQYAHDAKSYVSSDGRVLFETAATLLPEDTNGFCAASTYLDSQCVDVYTYKGGRLDLVSTGRADTPAHSYGASADGTTLAFYTADSLSARDVDGVTDAYVARLGGGFEPPARKPSCIGDECQGPVAGPPPATAPSSAVIRGRGDRRAARRAAFSIARIGAVARSKLARTGRIALRVRAARAGRVSVTARARVRGKVRVVMRGSKRARGAGSVRLALKLSRLARRSLASRGSLRISFAVRLSGASKARTTALRLTAPRRGAAGNAGTR